MTPSSERPFLGLLRGVEDALSLPIPARTRILEELESDLEALRARFQAEGLTPEDARRRAEEALVPSAEALGALETVHEPIYRTWARGREVSGVQRLERTGLAVLTGLVVIAHAALLAGTDLFRDPSPFLLPVLGLNGVLCVLIVRKGFELWIKGDHRVPERGLSRLLALSATIIVTALAGVLLDLYRLASTLERSGFDAQGLVVRWIVADCGLLAVAILGGLAGGLSWFVFQQWLADVHYAHLDALGADGILSNGGMGT